jgi:uncharacterized membrane protein HdeD (DUF308 family)
MPKETKKCEPHACCGRCMGAKMLILGILIILNVKYALFDWWTFVGGILGIKGILMLIMPSCPHCK